MGLIQIVLPRFSKHIYSHLGRAHNLWRGSFSLTELSRRTRLLPRQKLENRTHHSSCLHRRALAVPALVLRSDSALTCREEQPTKAISEGWFRSPVEGVNYRSSGSALPSLNLTLSSHSIKPPLKTSPLAAAANPYTDKPGNVSCTHRPTETLLERLRKLIPEGFISWKAARERIFKICWRKWLRSHPQKWDFIFNTLV